MDNQTFSNVKYIQKINLYKIACSTYTANNAKLKKKGGEHKTKGQPTWFCRGNKVGYPMIVYASLVPILPSLAWPSPL